VKDAYGTYFYFSHTSFFVLCVSTHKHDEIMDNPPYDKDTCIVPLIEKVVHS